MFWIILLLALLVAIGWTVFCCISREGFGIWLIGILMGVLLFGLLIGLYGTIINAIDWEYEEGKKVEEFELVSLRDDVTSVSKGNRRYISIYAENSYTYYLEVELPESYGEGTPYKSYTISEKNVFIVEDDKYIDNAKLVKYVRKPVENFWTSVVLVDKEEYVFYVPTGSIVKDISLND